MAQLTWTPPYFGVTHLGGDRLLDERYFQITVEAYSTFATVSVLSLRGDHPFTPIFEQTASSIQQAKAMGIEQLAVLKGALR
jgi:hypothetical protein